MYNQRCDGYFQTKKERFEPLNVFQELAVIAFFLLLLVFVEVA